MRKRLDVDIDGAVIPPAWLVEELKREQERVRYEEDARLLYAPSPIAPNAERVESEPKRGVAVWEV